MKPSRWVPEPVSSTPHQADIRLVAHAVTILSESSQALAELSSDNSSSPQYVMDALYQVSKAMDELAPVRRELAIHANEHGVSFRNVGRTSGVTHQTVRNWVAETEI